MQSYQDDRVVDGQPLPEDETARDLMNAKLEQLKSGDIDHFVVGRVPEVNELITVNGLKFVVHAAGPEVFTAKLFKP